MSFVLSVLVSLLCLQPPSAEVAPPTDPSGVFATPELSPARAADFRTELTFLLEAYEASPQSDPQLDLAMRAFLRSSAALSARTIDHPEYIQLYREAQALIEQGCKDPIVFAFHATSMAAGQALELARNSVDQALPALNNTKHHPIRKAAAWNLRSEVLSRVDKKASSEAFEQFVALALEACHRADMSDSECAWIAGKIAATLETRENLPHFKVVVESLQASKDADPWLREYLTGVFEIKYAWSIRGTAGAARVGDAQWQGFEQHLTLAYDALARSIELRPHLADPMRQMITIAMAGHTPPGMGVHYWLKRATDIHPDDDFAFRRALFALRPRWGGSYDQMLQLGLDSAATKQYGTLIPRWLGDSVVAVMEDMEDFDTVWRTKSVYKPLREALLGCLQHPAHAYEANTLKTELACAAARAGFLQHAREILDSLDWDDFDSRKASQYGFRQNDLRTRVYSDPNVIGPRILEAETLVQDQDYLNAVSVLRTIAEEETVAGRAHSAFAAGDIATHIEFATRFRSGSWIDLPLPRTKDITDLPGWREIAGEWFAVPQRDAPEAPMHFRVRSFSGETFQLLFSVPMHEPRYEIEVQVAGAGTSAHAWAGIIFGQTNQPLTPTYYMALYHRGASLIYATRELAARATKDVKRSSSSSTLRVQVWDSRVRVLFNDALIIDDDNFFRNDTAKWGFRPGTGHFGIGGGHKENECSATFRRIRVRRLTQEPADEIN